MRTEEGLTPLHYAARYTPLHSKAGGENEEDSAPVTLRSTSKQVLQVLIQFCHVDINVKDRDDLTPLHLACMRGNRVAVEILLAVPTPKVEIDAKDKKGDTPLHFACLNGDPEIVRMLLEKGADCLMPNQENELAIHVACAEGHLEIVKIIMRMCFDKRLDMMKWTDKEYNTPLHFACESGNGEIVKLLLLNNADPLACRMHDVTPLHIAAKEGFIDIASVLLQNDASEIDIPDANLLSPIHYAAQFGKVKMIEFLLQK